MYRSFVVLAASLLASGCSTRGFDVSQPLPQETVPSGFGGVAPSSFLSSPFRINIDVKQETAMHGAGPATSASLKSLTLQALTHDSPLDSFNFMYDLQVFVAAPSLPMVPIAQTSPTFKGHGGTLIETLSLDVVPNVDLLPYINAGATISAQASGDQPAQDFSYDGSLVITIHI
jgi:hypothetical protein